MSIQERRERERADRHRLIIRTARELAEAEGWEAVTTRRLAERIEYSQPVLYSHFANKDAIVAAVAVEGFSELAADLRAVVRKADGPARAFAAVADAYLAFGAANPALYDAMFTLATDLPFGKPEAPAPLKEAFAALAGPIAEVSGAEDPGPFTEMVWAALHGLVTLARSGRLRPDFAEHRLALLVERMLGGEALGD
ncbi:TetR/AcrR family transcriptional regulator [Streptomyces sp. CB01881]|uniref:TetR/AcrR family transcriptional regulator n=1 Tax=Streptomyces sp. CB01881 TaxID=2078691 RepID=UPI000CDBB22C|nr:TetR/AcrR family transcriptional regulator [Streptomyces sp. CB01881]AUY48691.1 TetR family transcriptional regulator [Streptomyces sp. CB01881]TYC77183.1 TetR/AcrR family transcriptional regulator [Streptomyces sp. CB01881]